MRYDQGCGGYVGIGTKGWGRGQRCAVSKAMGKKWSPHFPFKVGKGRRRYDGKAGEISEIAQSSPRESQTGCHLAVLLRCWVVGPAIGPI